MLKLALYQPDIPQNLGTNLRTAACFGIPIEIIEPCGFPLDDRKLHRAGMDYIEKAVYSRHISWQEFTKWAEANNHRVVLLSSHADNCYTDFSYKKGDVLLLGRESAGVPEEVTQYCGKNRITIPMRNGVRSLNVAVAGAIVLGEALRQIRALP